MAGYPFNLDAFLAGGMSEANVNHLNYENNLPSRIRTSVCGTNSVAHDLELNRRKFLLAKRYFSAKFGEDYFDRFSEAKTGIAPPTREDFSKTRPVVPVAGLPAELLVIINEPHDLHGADFRHWHSPVQAYLESQREKENAKLSAALQQKDETDGNG